MKTWGLDCNISFLQPLKHVQHLEMSDNLLQVGQCHEPCRVRTHLFLLAVFVIISRTLDISICRIGKFLEAKSTECGCMSQADGDLLVSSLREMANLQYLDLAGNNIMLNVSSQGTRPFCESGLFSLSYLRMSGNPLNTSLAPCLTGPGTTCPVCICLARSVPSTSYCSTSRCSFFSCA